MRVWKLAKLSLGLDWIVEIGRFCAKFEIATHVFGMVATFTISAKKIR